jgi:hypothetical protein
VSDSNRVQTCPNCGSANRVGVFFCEECHVPLTKAAELGMQTRYTDPDQLRNVFEQLQTTRDNSETLNIRQPTDKMPHPVGSTGTGVFREGMTLELMLIDATETISIQPTMTQSQVIGRLDAESNNFPDVDLVPFGGYRLGISRRHASLIVKDDQLLIADLSSSNGTAVNGDRLQPKTWTRLSEGDHLRLGHMLFLIRFKQG